MRSLACSLLPLPLTELSVVPRFSVKSGFPIVIAHEPRDNQVLT